MKLILLATLMLCVSGVMAAEEQLPISSDWIVFIKVKDPKNFSTIPAAMAGTKDKTVLPRFFRRASVQDSKGAYLWLNWFADQDFKERDLAVIFNEFESGKDQKVNFGFSVSYPARLYLNGSLVADTMKLQRNGTGNSPDTYQTQLQIKKGKNLLAVTVEANKSNWFFNWGIPSKSKNKGK